MIEVSVVIPTARRPALLRRALEALAAQSLPAPCYEIVVVDDAPSGARETFDRFARQSRPPCRYLRTRGGEGPAAARNRGWRAARGGVIAFTDDDTIPGRDWLRAGLAAFREGEGVLAVSGKVIVPLPEIPTDYERNEANLEHAGFVTANCFVLRETLRRLGGFDERFRLAWREDSELHFRLLDEADRRAGRIAHAEGARVLHPVREAPWGVSLSQQRKSLYNALLYRLHPRHYRSRIQPGPPWAYYGIVGGIVSAVALACAGRGEGRLPALVSGWLIGRFCRRRLRGTSHRPAHLAEMVVTSAAIPFLSVFYRCRGALRFRVRFF